MTIAPASGPVAILAGSGDLPLLLADRLAAGGRAHRILAFRGFAGRALRHRADRVLGLLDVEGSLACLSAWRPAAVTLAGGVRRPGPTVALDAFAAMRNRDTIARLMGQGDDHLLRAVVQLIEERGFPLLGVADLAPELLAEPVVYGRHAPDADQRASIATGFSLLASLSRFDIGQAAILRGERVLAIEGPEGTDKALRRATPLARPGLLRGGPRGGVLVKGPKLGQDLRVDLPAIGPRTVVEADRAGLDGIAVASGGTIVLDRPKTVVEADRRGLFLVGIDTAELARP